MSLPLAGRTVLVTRAPDQASDLIGLLEAAGAGTVALPTIAFFPPIDPRPLDKAVSDLSTYAWVAFTSANAVHALFERVSEPVAEHLGAARLAAVGPKTAEAIAQWGLVTSLVAAKGNATSLAEGLKRVLLPGQRVLYPRPERVADDLAPQLVSRGVIVDAPITYRTVQPSGEAFGVARMLRDGEIHWVAALSGSALRHLVGMLPEPEHLRRARVATIGPRTSAEAKALGLLVGAQAGEPSAEALVAAIVAAESPP